ncbi:MAG: hypothetical protein FJZ00_00510 [Candidatus Sericytochromatia bacterium]|uniref:DUF6036 domain-containing protein n=1 Tax=Candidatus Tanganyikabacteria bacterium TaxID=2961651 RepID=A0A938BHP5_9BACT|nr:hypothetical protein [Candidatus Tanganyikabacteria bacterium]
MTRDQLEHVIRAACTIAEVSEIVVVGSQAVLGQFPHPPETLTVSMEADVYPPARPELADLIDGSIGEDSPFFYTFGYCADGVDATTATLPEGWEGRLIRIQNENTLGLSGLCLEIHDLLISKCVAGREKDFRYLAAALEAGLASEDELLRRLASTPIDSSGRTQVAALIHRAARRS